MEYRYRGLTASLALVTVVALLVSFVSSAKRHSSEEERLLLQGQVQTLHEVNDGLEEKLRWVEGRFAEIRSLGRRLNHALAEEQSRSRTLADELAQQRRKAAEAASRYREALLPVGSATPSAITAFKDQRRTSPRVGEAIGPERLGSRFPLVKGEASRAQIE